MKKKRQIHIMYNFIIKHSPTRIQQSLMQGEAAAPQHSKPLWSAASLQNRDYFLEYLTRAGLPDIR
jgi:hypothetical protein